MKLTADALLFDNDGTLISSIESVVRCWTAWAGEYGVTAEAFGAIELHGRTSAEIISDLLPAGRVRAAVARIEELEIADVPHGGVVALPGSLALAGALPRERWAVVTSAGRRLARARLSATGLRPAVLVTAEDVERGKPDPEPYLLAARRLSAGPARCVVFEDAPAGLASGRAAGMTTVAVTTTHSAAELVADVHLPDLSSVTLTGARDGSVEIVLG